MNVGSLFSGIGGFDLGLERAGMRTVWFCEQDEFCQRVLAKHWPTVPCYPDIRRLVSADVEPIDVLAGGFPCQGLSHLGLKLGLLDPRSGLWSEYARLIGELRPRYVIVENVPALLLRGLDVVLGDLAARGYDAEWDCIPASAVGAPHQRDRIWIVAYPADPAPVQRLAFIGSEPDRDHAGAQDVADPARIGWRERTGPARRGRLGPTDGGERGAPEWWAAEPEVGRVAYGIPRRVDRLRSLGNALVPQIAEWIGRRIMTHERNANLLGEAGS